MLDRPGSRRRPPTPGHGGRRDRERRRRGAGRHPRRARGGTGRRDRRARAVRGPVRAGGGARRPPARPHHSDDPPRRSSSWSSRPASPRSPISGSSAPAVAAGSRIACRAVAWARARPAAAQRQLPGRRARPAVRWCCSTPRSACRRPAAAGRRRAIPPRAGARCAGSATSGLGATRCPTRGRSLLAPALLAASASDRPVIVVTDGEIEDAGDLPADLLARSRASGCSRGRRGPTWPSRASAGPARVTAGDSIPLDVEVAAIGGAAARQRDGRGRRSAASGSASRRAAAPERERARPARRSRSAAVGPGEHVLRVSLVGRGRCRAAHRHAAAPRHRGPDAGRRAARRARPTGTADSSTAPCARWPSFRCAGSSGSSPIAGARWPTSRVVPLETGAPGGPARRPADPDGRRPVRSPKAATARGIWRWRAAAPTRARCRATGICTAADASPLAGAFLGAAGGFVPARDPAHAGRSPSPASWMALTAQLGRRGAPRPAVFGRRGRPDPPGDRRGGRALALGLPRRLERAELPHLGRRDRELAPRRRRLGARAARGPCGRSCRTGGRCCSSGPGPGRRPRVADRVERRPARRAPTRCASTAAGGPRSGSLPASIAIGWRAAAAGRWRWRQYSDELLPRPVTLQRRTRRGRRRLASRRAARDWLWLFGLCVAGLAGEWIARRRLGLR